MFDTHWMNLRNFLFLKLINLLKYKLNAITTETTVKRHYVMKSISFIIYSLNSRLVMPSSFNNTHNSAKMDFCSAIIYLYSLEYNSKNCFAKPFYYWTGFTIYNSNNMHGVTSNITILTLRTSLSNALLMTIISTKNFAKCSNKHISNIKVTILHPLLVAY